MKSGLPGLDGWFRGQKQACRACTCVPNMELPHQDSGRQEPARHGGFMGVFEGFGTEGCRLSEDGQNTVDKVDKEAQPGNRTQDSVPRLPSPL